MAATERTFSIIKPDATRRNLTGKVNAVIEDAGNLRIVAQKRVRLSDAQAKKFYEVHKDRPFYGELVSQMTAEPVVVQVLEGERRRRRLPQGDGRHQSEGGDRRHHPQAVRPVDRRKLRSRFRQRGQRQDRNRPVLHGRGNPGLIKTRRGRSHF